VLLMMIVTPGLGIWLVWGYLKIGEWQIPTPFSIFGIAATTEMIGLNNILDWAFGQWVGWWTFTIGALLAFVGVASRS